MSAPKTPETVKQATTLAARFALLDTRIAAIEADRKVKLGLVNADADKLANPIIEEREKVEAALEAWWQSAGQDVLAKGRKSAQLGGCMIGTKTVRATLQHAFPDDAKAVEALRQIRYRKQTTRVKYELDRAGTVKLLTTAGKAAEVLTELGFSIKQGENFFVHRVEQPGTAASA